MPSDQKWEFFLSHVQREAGGEAVQLAQALGGPSRCWLDRLMPDKSVQGMREGVLGARVFLCVLTPGYFASTYCLRELAWAIQAKKTVVPLFPSGVSVGPILAAAPESVETDDGDVLALRRRLQSIEAIMIDCKDVDYFRTGVTKIHQRAGTFRSTDAAPAPAGPAAAQTLRSRALKAAAAVGHDCEGKHLRQVVDALALSVVGSRRQGEATLAQKLLEVERQLAISAAPRA